MALNPKELEGWREKLQTLRTSLEQELAGSREATRPVDLGEPIGRLTRMDAMQQQQMALARRDRLRTRLQSVDAALGRIENGSYGECLRCEEEIEPRRLEARPETFFCLRCQKEGG